MVSEEQLLYSIYGSKLRSLIPKAASLFALSAIFYLFVLINISLLELNAEQETALKTGSLAVLIILILLGVMFALRKVQQPYLFYKNRVTHGKEMIYYLNITNNVPKMNLLDKFFKTYSIMLGKSFALQHIPETIQKTQLSNYLQQLIEFSRKNQSQ